MDRALVAGLILEVMLEAPEELAGGTTRPQAVKSRIKDYLVEHLAGKVTLDRFRTLASRLDCWFEFYYPLLTPPPPPKPARTADTVYYAAEPATPYRVCEAHASNPPSVRLNPPASPPRPVFWEEILDRWLTELEGGFPQRPHRKISRRRVKEFLQQTAGGWFKLRDFEKHFQIDRKTAWDYLQQFLQAGLVCHNRRQSAAVRYCAAPALLKVEADTLRLALSLICPDLPEERLEHLGDLLIASGGEAFAEREWRTHFAPEKLESLFRDLSAHGILSIQAAASGARWVRLRRRWLQPGPSPSAH